MVLISTLFIKPSLIFYNYSENKRTCGKLYPLEARQCPKFLSVRVYDTQSEII